LVTSRRLAWAELEVRIEEGMKAFKILTGKYTGKRPLERLGPRLEENIRIEIKQIDVNMRTWIDSGGMGIIEEPLWVRHSTSMSYKPTGS